MKRPNTMRSSNRPPTHVRDRSTTAETNIPPWASFPPSRTPFPTPWSTAAIVEGLKQGNAIELQLVKQLQSELETIAAGLRREGYKKSDALDELSENVAVV